MIYLWEQLNYNKDYWIPTTKAFTKGKVKIAIDTIKRYDKVSLKIMNESLDIVDFDGTFNEWLKSDCYFEINGDINRFSKISLNDKFYT